MHILSRFGFSFTKGGVHTARTMMLEELELLFGAVANPKAAKDEYLKVIIEHNCLKKRSVKSRQLTARHLINLYTLNPSIKNESDIEEWLDEVKEILLDAIQNGPIGLN